MNQSPCGHFEAPVLWLLCLVNPFARGRGLSMLKRLCGIRPRLQKPSRLGLGALFGSIAQRQPLASPGPAAAKHFSASLVPTGSLGVQLRPAAQGRRWVMKVCSRCGFFGEGRGSGGGWTLLESKACVPRLFSPPPACFPTSTTTSPILSQAAGGESCH